MPARKRLFWRPTARLLIAAAASLLVPTLIAAPADDALLDYLKIPDSSFAWKILEKRKVEGLEAARLEFVSQTWRSNAWKHEMLVVRPRATRNPRLAFLSISGDRDVAKSFGMLRTIASEAGVVAAVVNQVPNQPFYGGRKEDALIAYTLNEYTKSGDRTWPLLFPMTKSAVRAMDVITAFMKQAGTVGVEEFVVSGASKRGWTTWLTAAEDSRVKAIAPAVIDMLNMKAQAQWAKAMYGKQSAQIKDYTEISFTDRMDEPRVVELRQWIDPFSYRERYNMPKLLLLGTNDPYWVVDSLRHYWSELPEPKLVFQTPNAGHDLAGGRRAIPTLAAFVQMIADGETLPKMTWNYQGGVPAPTENVSLSVPASSFTLWTADSDDRDFRDDTWTSKTVTSGNPTNLTVTIPTPKTGFRAYFVEAEMKTAAGNSYQLSTEARVTPDGPPKPVVP